MVLSSLTIVNILEKTIHTQSCLMYWWPTLHICLVNSNNISSHINNIIKYRSRFNSNNSLLLFGSLGTCTSPVSLNNQINTSPSGSSQLILCQNIFLSYDENFGTGVTPMSQGSQNDVTLEDSLTRSRETNCSKNTQIFWCCALFCLFLFF